MKERETRWSVLMAARMQAVGPSRTIRIRDVSSRGLMIEADPAPARGNYVEIVAPGLSVIGRVVWSRDGRCGIRTRDPIDLRQLRGGSGSAEPAGPAARPAFAVPGPAAAELREVSSAFARRLQFMILAGAGALAGASIVATGYQSLMDTFGTISKTL